MESSRHRIRSKQSLCTLFQARVEYTHKFSEEEFEALNGAQAALEAFHRGIKTEDKEDNRCYIFIKWFPTHLRSWLTGFLPKKRNLTFKCAGTAPPATIPLARNDTEMELLVLKNNSARTLLLLTSIMLA